MLVSSIIDNSVSRYFGIRNLLVTADSTMYKIEEKINYTSSTAGNIIITRLSGKFGLLSYRWSITYLTLKRSRRCTTTKKISRILHTPAASAAPVINDVARDEQRPSLSYEEHQFLLSNSSACALIMCKHLYEYIQRLFVFFSTSVFLSPEKETHRYTSGLLDRNEGPLGEYNGSY